MASRSNSRFTRREFLRLSVLAGAGAGIAACTTATPQTTSEATSAATAGATTAPATSTPAATERPVQISTATLAPTREVVATYKEAPMLAEMVSAGTLPPVAERLPKVPKVLPTYESIGQYGGTWRRAYRGVSDRFGVHTTIVDHLLEMYMPEGGDLTLIPNVAESYTVNEDATEFTWKLREGMKWSDGTDLKSDAAVWWYENIYLNEEIAPGHLYDNVRQQQNLTSITADGDYAFKTTYSKPNGTLPLGIVRGEAWALIGGLNFMAPGHYLKDFHKNFVEAAKLDELVKQYNLQTWNQLFLEGPIAMFALNPDLPVVGPWKTKVAAGADRMVQDRNPYYFQVDEEGNQLPYMDEITHDIFENQESFNLKLISGEVDLQIRHVQLKDYALLKENESKGNYRVIVWKSDENFGYMVNPTPRNEDTTVDEAQAEIVSKADFRRALSLAINRDEVNDLLFNGLAIPRASSPVPGSPVYKQEYDEAWSAYDPEQANALLDGLGLTERDAEGFRKRPDGQTLTIRMDVDTAPGSINDDMNQLVKGYWEAVGVKTVVNAMERSLRETIQFSDRFSVAAGGISNTAVPLSFDAWHNTIGGGWGRYLRNPADPLAIEPPEDNEEVALAQEIWGIIQEAYGLVDIDAAHARLMEALDLWYDQVYNIGVVGATPAPGVVTNRMRNVPDNLIWGNALMRVNMAQPAQVWIDE